MDTTLLGILVVLVVMLIVLVIIALLRKGQNAADPTTILRGFNEIQVELRGVSERVSTVERNQGQLTNGIVALGSGLTETGAVARGVAETAAAIRQELSRAKNDLTALQTLAKSRQDLEQRTAESIKRLELVIAGSQSRGAAGENLLESLFASFPSEWQVRGFKVGNKTVEFGLRLPNKLILPIDSKWPATDLLERFACCDDPVDKQSLKEQIEKKAVEKAKEVTKYIDPNLTVNFGLAVVPDAVYDLCSAAQVEAFKANVVIIGHSLFVPYLLLVFQTMLKASQSIDTQKLEAYLQNAQDSIGELQREIEGPLADAITRLNNSRGRLAGQVSNLNSRLVSLQIGSKEMGADANMTEVGNVL